MAPRIRDEEVRQDFSIGQGFQSVEILDLQTEVISRFPARGKHPPG